MCVFSWYSLLVSKQKCDKHVVIAPIADVHNSMIDLMDIIEVVLQLVLFHLHHSYWKHHRHCSNGFARSLLLNLVSVVVEWQLVPGCYSA